MVVLMANTGMDLLAKVALTNILYALLLIIFPSVGQDIIFQINNVWNVQTPVKHALPQALLVILVLQVIILIQHAKLVNTPAYLALTLILAPAVLMVFIRTQIHVQFVS